jgi:hypothetical protein
VQDIDKQKKEIKQTLHGLAAINFYATNQSDAKNI